ncbi:MAG: hypothetical protein K2H17_08050 [Duncaniella sp.]|uniref:hypothetical protein n=1 Tax=Duncaniella sp. TaxID=2518496 RepID=UPI0023BE11C6|nr:hypothetical protein [Duncaniella sp.]MDE5989337.1 hypothetical protein [Duncaniella sp.]
MKEDKLMKLTGRQSLKFRISLTMACVGVLGAGIMLGTGLNWGLLAAMAVTAIVGSVWTSKILKPVPNVGLIIKYNFPKDAGYYQKGKRKTTPVNDDDILYHIKMFLPFIQIGMFVFAAALRDLEAQVFLTANHPTAKTNIQLEYSWL